MSPEIIALMVFIIFFLASLRSSSRFLPHFYFHHFHYYILEPHRSLSKCYYHLFTEY